MSLQRHVPSVLERTQVTMNALIIVDMQQDFMEGGALGVLGARYLVPKLVRKVKNFDLVIGTRDWHPGDHKSFAQFAGKWPTHCIKGTSGSMIVPGIDRLLDVVVSKGTDPDTDGYSATENPVFIPMLKHHFRHFDYIKVAGVALDYCVSATAIDIARAGFINVCVDISDTVSVDPSTDESTVHKLKEAGVIVADA
jgi:nicotinamidase/pyrazinamidase